MINMVTRITADNKTLLNDAFFELFPYNDKINSADIADKITADNRTYLYLAYRDEQIAGYTLAYRFPALFNKGDLAYIYDVEVLPNYRRQGIGTELITTIIAALKQDGATEAWLGTDTDNEPALALYKATGAEISDEMFYDLTYKLD